MFPDSKKTKNKRDSQVISKLKLKQTMIEARIKNLLDKGEDVQQEIDELHEDLKKKLRLRSLVLKRSNGGLLPEEEIELQSLGEC